MSKSVSIVFIIVKISTFKGKDIKNEEWLEE